jgi:hypothetical protein
MEIASLLLIVQCGHIVFGRNILYFLIHLVALVSLSLSVCSYPLRSTFIYFLQPLLSIAEHVIINVCMETHKVSACVCREII